MGKGKDNKSSYDEPKDEEFDSIENQSDTAANSWDFTQSDFSEPEGFDEPTDDNFDFLGSLQDLKPSNEENKSLIPGISIEVAKPKTKDADKIRNIQLAVCGVNGVINGGIGAILGGVVGGLSGFASGNARAHAVSTASSLGLFLLVQNSSRCALQVLRKKDDLINTFVSSFLGGSVCVLKSRSPTYIFTSGLTSGLFLTGYEFLVAKFS